jgi:hypothetical protein
MQFGSVAIKVYGQFRFVAAGTARPAPTRWRLGGDMFAPRSVLGISTDGGGRSSGGTGRGTRSRCCPVARQRWWERNVAGRAT